MHLYSEHCCIWSHLTALRATGPNIALTSMRCKREATDIPKVKTWWLYKFSQLDCRNCMVNGRENLNVDITAWGNTIDFDRLFVIRQKKKKEKENMFALQCQHQQRLSFLDAWLKQIVFNQLFVNQVWSHGLPKFPLPWLSGHHPTSSADRTRAKRNKNTWSRC